MIVINSRIEEINSYLQKAGSATIRELNILFPEVSEMTIRRDLELLEKQSEIVRTRGGAKSILSLLSSKEDDYIKRAIFNPDGKRIIAEKAVKLLEKGRSVFFDAGTTMMALSKIMPDEPYHIITSAPNIALEVLKNKTSTVLLTGGRISRDNVCISGSSAYHFMEDVNVDIAFMVTSGFSESGGFTSGNIDECELKKLVIKKAGRVIMLMDASKMNKTLPYTFANLKDIDVLISDQKLPAAVLKAAKQHNIKII